MSNNAEAQQVIKDLLIAAGFSADIDYYTNLFLLKIYKLAWGEYLQSLEPEAAQQLEAEANGKTDEQQLQFIVDLLSQPQHLNFLQSAAQNVAQEFSALTAPQS